MKRRGLKFNKKTVDVICCNLHQNIPAPKLIPNIPHQDAVSPPTIADSKQRDRNEQISA